MWTNFIDFNRQRIFHDSLLLSLLCGYWRLVIAMHIYNEKDQAGQKDIQVHSWRGQTAQEMVELCLVLKEIKKKGVKEGGPLRARP